MNSFRASLQLGRYRKHDDREFRLSSIFQALISSGSSAESLMFIAAVLTFLHPFDADICTPGDLHPRHL
jgi:tetrahydromethanopterin S-methyltransferase subunit C